MADDTSNPSPSRNLQTFLAAEKTEADGKLSLFGRVAVDADRMQGKIPRFHEGMTLDDAVLITGLPREEAARRIQEMRGHDHPGRYAATRLAVGAGERFLAGRDAAPEPEWHADGGSDVHANPPAPATTAKVIRFPLPFGEDTRAVSNPLARCALFAAVKERAYFRDYVVVGMVAGVKVEFCGEQFNQDDHDTFLQLVKMALHQPYGAEVVQSVNAILTGLGRHTRQEQRAQLFEQSSRLVRGTVRLTFPNGQRYEGHLVDDVTTPEDQKVLPRLRRHLSYRLNPRFAMFYAEAAYTLFDFRQRLRIKGRGSELAKWLQLWIESNAEQYPHKVETLHQKCGSKDKTLKSFRQKLRFALNCLKEAGVITAWHIGTDDLVHINRTPSEAQQQHLARLAGKASPRKAAVPEAQAGTRRATQPTRPLKPETVEKFRALYPRLDPYACQADFDAWMHSKPTPRSYDAAFLGFAKKWAVGKG